MKIRTPGLLFLIIAFALAAAAPPAAAQAEKAPPVFGISLSGFVKTDIFYDSRQTVSIREGHYLLYPKGPLLDPGGRDINARSSFNILSIQTRLAGRITGPDVLGAKTSAYIEAEFFGTSDADINGFRLRHGSPYARFRRCQIGDAPPREARRSDDSAAQNADVLRAGVEAKARRGQRDDRTCELLRPHIHDGDDFVSRSERP
jgi:hypothetical protein